MELFGIKAAKPVQLTLGTLVEKLHRVWTQHRSAPQEHFGALASTFSGFKSSTGSQLVVKNAV